MIAHMFILVIWKLHFIFYSIKRWNITHQEVFILVLTPATSADLGQAQFYSERMKPVGFLALSVCDISSCWKTLSVDVADFCLSPDPAWGCPCSTSMGAGTQCQLCLSSSSLGLSGGWAPLHVSLLVHGLARTRPPPVTLRVPGARMCCHPLCLASFCWSECPVELYMGRDPGGVLLLGSLMSRSFCFQPWLHFIFKKICKMII